MNQDLQKLIDIAKEGGAITPKQKEIILKKAQELGEDLDEVEMVLESIQSKQAAKEPIKKSEGRRKCPNCGATISGTTLVCPECGYVLQQESKASIEARESIEMLQDKLTAATQSSSSSIFSIFFPFSQFSQYKKPAAVVNAFSMPTTKDGLILFLEFAYSNYVALGHGVDDMYSRPLKNAWYSKTIQARNSLERLGGNDPEIKAVLEKYSSLISKEKKKLGILSKYLIGIIVFILLSNVFFWYIMPHWYENSKRAQQEKIENCLRNNDFVGARLAARNILGGDWDTLDQISVQEVSYLITQGDYEQAKIVASGVYDPEKKDAVLSSIQNAEKQPTDN